MMKGSTAREEEEAVHVRYAQLYSATVSHWGQAIGSFLLLMMLQGLHEAHMLLWTCRRFGSLPSRSSVSHAS